MGHARGVRVAVDDKEVRPVGGDDEPLLALHREPAVLQLRPGRGAEEIGAAPGFRQGLGGNQIPLEQRLEELLLLLLRPEGVEGLPYDGGHREGAAEGRPEDAHLLQGGDLRAPGETRTAVLLVEAQAEEVVVPQCLDELMTFR
ncbi:MAG: hypothetical protein A2X95_04330 [Syntrophobacterales bacterium GWF2_56_9]|nr:MAG: hypothetical protein A2X95_04330 [Syntrophobacterales bacterium GWF2_56_9]